MRLPTQHKISEYSITKRFSSSLSPGHIQDELNYAIRGRGAFRRLKDGVRYHGVAQQWYDFRDQA